MNDALYLAQAGALLLVILRMSWLHLDDTRPREFVALAAWFALCCLTLTGINSPALHLAVWIFILPAAVAASRQILPEGAGMVIAGLLLSAAAAHQVTARWGATPNVAVFTARCWIGITFGAVLLAACRRGGRLDRLRLGMGGFFLVYCGGQQALAAFDAWHLLAPLVFLSTLIWLALAWFIAPTPDALINTELLALSPRPTAPSPLGELTGTFATEAAQRRAPQPLGERPKPPLPAPSSGGARG